MSLKKMSLEMQRKIVRVVLSVGAIGGIGYYFSDGVPILFGPRASAADIAGGKMLFEHQWTKNDPLAQGDGLGPVFNANSCVACHFQGGVGGAGPNNFNVTNFQVFAIPGRTTHPPTTGTIHTGATDKSLAENLPHIRKLFPVVKSVRQTIDDGHCRYERTLPDVDPVRINQVSTPALFGAGWIDRVSEKAILNNHRRLAIQGIVKELSLDFDAVPQGRPRILPDGRVGKFGWKAQFATLEEFVAAACTNELGLGVPTMAQAAPVGHKHYVAPEKPDLTNRQFRELVAFIDTLPKPKQQIPADAAGADAVAKGEKLFRSIGCAICHTPDLGGVKGLYSDLLLHTLDDPTPGQNEPGGGSYEPPLPEGAITNSQPDRNEWRTPPLWGVADSAPYLHDGSAPTLELAIMRHGNDAKKVRDEYKKLPVTDQQAVIAFLKSLKAPAAGE